jgi:hypothetical protein
MLAVEAAKRPDLLVSVSDNHGKERLEMKHMTVARNAGHEHEGMTKDTKSLQVPFANWRYLRVITAEKKKR